MSVAWVAIVGCTPPSGYVFDGRAAEGGVDVVVPADSGIDVLEGGVDAMEAGLACEGGVALGPDAGLVDAAVVCDGGACDPAVAIASGAFHTCALRSSGTVVCWGDNSFEQLGRSPAIGDAGSAPFVTPIVVAGITPCDPAIALAAGGLHSCAILRSGHMVCWGRNGDAELGVPPGTGSTDDPRPVTRVDGLPIGVTFVDLALGYRHTCARSVDGKVYCWGRGADGALGDGSFHTESQAMPLLVALSNTATAIAAGDDHSCAILQDETGACWGRDDYGQLGDGATANQPGPVPIAALTALSSLAGGTGFTCATQSTMKFQCWGADEVGERGDEMISAISGPAPTVPGWSGAAASHVTAWNQHACALSGMPPAQAQCWGSDGSGELGDGAPSSSQSSPVQVHQLSDAVALAAGQTHTCALRATGAVVCWGDNVMGQLGNGDTGLNASATPVPVVGLP